jgi:hypothetical protein
LAENRTRKLTSVGIFPKPWPSYSGRAAAIALRLVEGLAGEPRRDELARICHWRPKEAGTLGQ